MFDFVIRAGQAYEQAGFFIGAIICLGLGGLILGNLIYWHVCASRVAGTIIGVIAKNRMYTTVYRFTLPDGRTQEARAAISSSSTAGRETGHAVALLVIPHDPKKVSEAGFTPTAVILASFGAIFAAVGVWLGYTALFTYPATWMTWIMAPAFLIYAGVYLRKILIPKDNRLSLAEWRKKRGLDAPLDLNSVKPIEQILASPWQSRLAAPIVAIFAIILFGAGVYQGAEIARLQTAGLRADGEVVGLKREFSSSGTRHSSYYPIIRFRTEKDVRVSFKHDVGSYPPSYGRGDKVNVLYLAGSPAKTAIIDNGALRNWAIPAALLLVAALLFWMLIAIMRRRRADATASPPAAGVISGRAGPLPT
jgi:hypothetical protein